MFYFYKVSYGLRPDVGIILEEELINSWLFCRNLQIAHISMISLPHSIREQDQYKVQILANTCNRQDSLSPPYFLLQ